MKKTAFLTILASFFALSAFVTQNTNADKLLGVWVNGTGKANIKIEKIGSKFYGKIVWLKEPIDPTTKKPKVDKNNPDAKLKNTPLKGLRILKDFTYNEKSGEWENGTIYDPENGSTYSCVIKRKDDNTLDIRGYIGVKALGRTDTWKRVTAKK